MALTPEESANEEPVPEQNDSESAAPGPCMPTPGQLERATPDLGAAPFQPPVFRASSLSTLSTARGRFIAHLRWRSALKAVPLLEQAAALGPLTAHPLPQQPTTSDLLFSMADGL